MSHKKSRFYIESNIIKDALTNEKNLVKKYNSVTDSSAKAICSILMNPKILTILNKQGAIKLQKIFNKIHHVAKYAPQNFDISTLLEPHSDLDYIDGKFCTFDAKLAKLQKQNATTEIYSRAAKITKTSRTNNAYKIANDIISLLSTKKYKKILKKLDCAKGIDFYEEYLYSIMLSQLSKDLAKKRGIKERLHATLISDWSQAPKYAQPKQTNTYTYKGYYSECCVNGTHTNHVAFVCKNAITAKNSMEMFSEILAVFSHEFGHFVDNVAPDNGALGAQIMAYCGYPHPKSHKQYLEIPTEKSSHTNYEIVLQRLTQKLNQRQH